MLNSRPALACCLTLILAACSSSSAAPASEPASPVASSEPAAEPLGVEPASASLAGIYSDAQAERGGETFNGVCGECHYVNEFRDQQFKYSWRRRSVGDLFSHISDTMPENAPGSLSPKQYADVVAYILSLNGVEAGTAELPSDPDDLDAYALASLSGT